MALSSFSSTRRRPPSFFRSTNRKNSGDDLSSFRFTVIATNKNQKPTRGLEGGVAGLGVRGMVPVFHVGKHVGSVEFGMTFGQAFFDNFKAQNGIDAGLHILDKDAFKTMAATFGKEPLLSVDLLKKP